MCFFHYSMLRNVHLRSIFINLRYITPEIDVFLCFFSPWIWVYVKKQISLPENTIGLYENLTDMLFAGGSFAASGT